MAARTTTTSTLETPEVDLVYDVHGPLPTPDGRPVLLMAGHPMAADGFTALADELDDRTVVTFDPRGVGRSVRKDGSDDRSPELHAADLHALISHLEVGPVELFASSGGAVNALELVATHPTDVTTLVAHEPPLLAVLPDAERAFAAERKVQQIYQDRGFGAGIVAFIVMTSWQGEFTDAYEAQPLPDPAQFGMPTGDDGSRNDPLLSGTGNGITHYEIKVDALLAAPTRVVLAVGVESAQTITGRTTAAAAAALGRSAETFPSHHGGFMGGDGPMAGQPVAFAARLRDVLADG